MRVCAEVGECGNAGAVVTPTSVMSGEAWSHLLATDRPHKVHTESPLPHTLLNATFCSCSLTTLNWVCVDCANSRAMVTSPVAWVNHWVCSVWTNTLQRRCFIHEILLFWINANIHCVPSISYVLFTIYVFKAPLQFACGEFAFYSLSFKWFHNFRACRSWMEYQIVFICFSTLSVLL